jgi:ribosomal protein S18 acetylase RimI-like enzyme
MSCSASSRPTVTLQVRRDLLNSDRSSLEALLVATGFFNAEELEVALELVDDRLHNGPASHYRFLVAATGDAAGGGAQQVSGYASWGPIPGTVSSVDLYWIAVHPAAQGLGIGRALLDAAEAWVREEGRDRVWVETSSRPQYAPTRSFYHACGYQEAARLPDFYGPADAKVVLLKVLRREAPSGWTSR